MNYDTKPKLWSTLSNGLIGIFIGLAVAYFTSVGQLAKHEVEIRQLSKTDEDLRVFVTVTDSATRQQMSMLNDQANERVRNITDLLKTMISQNEILIRSLKP